MGHPPTAARIGVLVVAYNAESTLAAVLDRLPRGIRSRLHHVLICDDASADGTYTTGLGYQATADMPVTVVRHPVNLGYGGNQKHGYHWAIDCGLDIVVLLHADGQYAPEIIERLIEPLEDGCADAVFGSRMMVPGSARRGGMPAYKYVGNRILSSYENAVVGLELTEWHSGYRAYRVDALADIPFDRNADGFAFDTEIILQLHEAGKTIIEVPIPTYYGDEICNVDGLRYARDVATAVTRYRLHKLGLGSGEMAFADDTYGLKTTLRSSHGQLLAWLADRPPARVLDIGCSDGRFGELARQQGHEVVGVDIVRHPDVTGRLDAFVEADLNDGLPTDAGADYDVIVAADVLEHIIDPAALLGAIRGRLGEGGSVLVSVPNFAHWYPRIRVASGRFDYDRRGILDRGHLRFFTRRSFERLVDAQGYRIARRAAVGLPVPDGASRVSNGGTAGILRRWGCALGAVDRQAVLAWPTMFGYQFLYELVPA